MFTTRRRILAFAAQTFLLRLAFRKRAIAASSLPEAAPKFDLDQLLDTCISSRPHALSCKYAASATVTLFSIPLVSKTGVGSGYTVIEEAAGKSGKITSIQFGAGSWPESARGLNRLGFIQEAVLEKETGNPVECAYLAFMTTSQEKDLDQAKKALRGSGALVPYSAAQGCSKPGRITSRVDRLQFPSNLTWRDIPVLLAKAREAMAAGTEPHRLLSPAPGTPDLPVTFLYAVRAALLNPAANTKGQLFFNSKQFLLETVKEKDPASGAHFHEKKIVSKPSAVIKLSAVLTEHRTGQKTPFRLWYEHGAEQAPPLRFEYQAKSFLRLTFEVDTAAEGPPIRLAFRGSRENA